LGVKLGNFVSKKQIFGEGFSRGSKSGRRGNGEGENIFGDGERGVTGRIFSGDGERGDSGRKWPGIPGENGVPVPGGATLHTLHIQSKCHIQIAKPQNSIVKKISNFKFYMVHKYPYSHISVFLSFGLRHLIN
jgi:hypothetical protein